MKALLIIGEPSDEWSFLGPDRSPVLLPLLDRTVLQHQIESLIDQGIKDITVAAMTAVESTRNVIRDGSRWGVKIVIHSLTSTADLGPFAHSIAAGEDLIIGDAAILATLPAAETAWTAFDGKWRRENAVATEPQQLTDLPFVDVSTPSAYLDAWEHLASDDSVKIVRSGRPAGEGIVIGRGCHLDPTVEIKGPAYIGERCFVAKGCRIGPNAFVGADCIIEDGSILADGVVLPYTYVGSRLEIRRKIAYRSTIFDLDRNLAVGSVDEFILGASRNTGDRPPSFSVRLVAFLASIVLLPVTILGGLIALASPVAKSNIGYRSAFVDFLARFLPGLWLVVFGKRRMVGAPEVSPDVRRELEILAPGLVSSTPTGLVSDAYLRFGPQPGLDDLWASIAFSAAANDSPSQRMLVREYLEMAFGIRRAAWKQTGPS
jgi:mannose-1-phosphate guanylyltransferase / phosphomannomutase